MLSIVKESQMNTLKHVWNIFVCKNIPRHPPPPDIPLFISHPLAPPYWWRHSTQLDNALNTVVWAASGLGLLLKTATAAWRSLIAYKAFVCEERRYILWHVATLECDEILSPKYFHILNVFCSLSLWKLKNGCNDVTTEINGKEFCLQIELISIRTKFLRSSGMMFEPSYWNSILNNKPQSIITQLLGYQWILFKCFAWWKEAE